MSRLNTPALALVAAILLVISGCSGQNDDDIQAEIDGGHAVSITMPWMRATQEGMAMSAAYGVIRNAGTETDALIAVSSPVAEAVELHESTKVDGRSQMRPVSRLEIEPDGLIILESGGYHVMLMGLTQPLEDGKSYDVTFTFEKAGEVTVPVMAMDGVGGTMDMDH